MWPIVWLKFYKMGRHESENITFSVLGSAQNLSKHALGGQSAGGRGRGKDFFDPSIGGVGGEFLPW